MAAGINSQKSFVEIGSIRGIPVRLHLSWLLVVFLATSWLATRFLPQASPDSSPGTYWGVGALTALWLFLSVLLHEVGHAAVAIRAEIPVNGISLLMFGGATRIARKPQTARADVGMAVAGPLISLLLAVLFSGLAVVQMQGSMLGPALALLAVVNLLLAATNLVPAYPLDGGRVLRGLYWYLSGSRDMATRLASHSGQVAALVLLCVGLAVALLGLPLPGLLLAATAIYLGYIAGVSLKQLQLQEMAAGLRVGDLVLAPCPTAPQNGSLGRLAGDRDSRQDQPGHLVVSDGDPKEPFRSKELGEAGHCEGDATQRAATLPPLTSVPHASSNDDAWSLLERMAGDELEEIPVADGSRFLGLLTRESLWNQIRWHGQRTEAP